MNATCSATSGRWPLTAVVTGAFDSQAARGRGIRDGQQMKARGLEMLVTEAHQPLDVAIIVVGQLHGPASHKSHSHARTSVSVIVRRSKPARTRALRSRS